MNENTLSQGLMETKIKSMIEYLREIKALSEDFGGEFLASILKVYIKHYGTHAVEAAILELGNQIGGDEEKLSKIRALDEKRQTIKIEALMVKHLEHLSTEDFRIGDDHDE